MTDMLSQLQLMSTAPTEPTAFAAWLDLEDALQFLEENAQEEEFVVYAGAPHCFVHAVLVPIALVAPPDIDDLMSWNLSPSSSWGVSLSFNPRSISISPPLDHTGSKTLDQGEQLVFLRHFEGRLGDKGYLEFLQKFVHLFDLHFMAETNAYCRLDRRGDIEEVIRIRTLPGATNGTVVTVERAVLDEYMALTDSAAVRTFDFTRFNSSKFGSWSNADEPKVATRGEITYRSVFDAGHASYIRGVQIVRPQVSRDAVAARFDRSEQTGKEYESFVAYDWKNRVVREISCAPGATANYFTKSDLPYEMSPVFFRPEVLVKYKADSDKYRLEERSISCRGAWHLETYDMNEAGQVHTYIVYLRRLPHEEQLHWKAYNEAPKASISKRAVKTDFEGNWDLEYDPLSSLKQLLREWTGRKVPWWSLRSERLVDKVHYPVTRSADEWANELLHLDQLIVEGFEEKWLRGRAVSLGRAPDERQRSLKLVEEILMGLGFERDRAMGITAPFHHLHELRSKLKSHASGTEATQMRRDAIAKHGNLAAHFRALTTTCDESLRIVNDAFKNLS